MLSRRRSIWVTKEKHVPQRKTLFTRRPDSSTQSVSVVTGFSGKTSPSRMQRMAALLDMVELMIVEDGYATWHGCLPTEKDAVTKHTFALEKGANYTRPQNRPSIAGRCSAQRPLTQTDYQ